MANRRDNRGRPGWLGHAKKVEKANGMGEADYRGLMALGRSSIAFPGQWDTIGGGFTPRNNITWFIFLRQKRQNTKQPKEQKLVANSIKKGIFLCAEG